MSAIHVKKRVDSETLHLPELKPLIGKTVEIIIQEQRPEAAAPDPYAAFMELAGQDVVDPEAYKQLRAASHI